MTFPKPNVDRVNFKLAKPDSLKSWQTKYSFVFLYNYRRRLSV
jgi:hypothetical protein